MFYRNLLFLAKEYVTSAYFKVRLCTRNPCRFHTPPVSESRPTLSVNTVLYNFLDYQHIPSLPLTTTISLVPCRAGWDFGCLLVQWSPGVPSRSWARGATSRPPYGGRQF